MHCASGGGVSPSRCMRGIRLSKTFIWWDDKSLYKEGVSALSKGEEEARGDPTRTIKSLFAKASIKLSTQPSRVRSEMFR